ncbi:MAG: O-antigen ligase family protein [Saprospiraceae bacterium]
MKGFDRLIWILFCVYVFMLPFENITKVMWQIESPYRPYRILALLIGLLIVISRKPQGLKFYKNDLNLVWVYLFGLIPSMIAWSKGMLLAESFWLTSIQYFIVLWIFLLIKSLPFTIRNIYQCMDLFCFGVVINSIYMLYLFGFEDMGRQSGWMDNPNFAAFACNVAFTYFFYQFYHTPASGIKKFSWLVAVFILFAGLLVTGSRSALISFALSMILIILFQFNWKQTMAKTGLVVISLLLLSLIIDFNRLADAIPAWNRLVTLSGKEEARSTLWLKGLEAFKDSDFIGLGIEQFKNPKNYSRFVGQTENVSVANQAGLVLHNDYLTVLVEYGILAFVCFVGFYIGIKKGLNQIYLSNQNLFVFKVCFWNMAVFSMFASSFQSHALWFVYIILTFVFYISINKSKEFIV